jgi:phage shock protein A
MKRLAQTRPPETLARALNRIATLEQRVQELEQATRLLAQVDPVLEQRIQDLETAILQRHTLWLEDQGHPATSLRTTP